MDSGSLAMQHTFFLALKRENDPPIDSDLTLGVALRSSLGDCMKIVVSIFSLS